MAYSVRIADPAAEELERAVAYIAVMLGQPSAATALADEFAAKLDVLADNPLLYAVDEDMAGMVGAEVRHCPVKGYALWFTVDDAAGAVDIVAFLHGRQDIRRHLSWRF